ncbi:recombinase family protein [Streptomyces sp. NPDC015492]|uniref:recombinase family protein n=1 Tax=Streptomyces sp. NPDC015492 TaxID=3364958 RepID=UPI0036F947C8
MTSNDTVYPPGARALLMARISRDEDRSTSISRQMERLRLWQTSHDLVTAGEVMDRSVSGSIDPSERPQLGPWLTPEGLARWDVMAVVSQDRLGRDDMHFLAFVHLLLSNNKTIEVLDDPSLDLSTPRGRLIAYVKATSAAEELYEIRKRCADSRRHLRNQGNYGGGQTPCGYIPERPYPEANAVLIPDGQYRDLLRGLAERVRGGEAPHVLCLELNMGGVLTWRDRVRQLKRDTQAAIGAPVTAKEPRGTRWKASVLAQMLRSPAIAGYLLTQGRIHELESGEPAMITEFPILTHSEWQATVRALDKRSPDTPRRSITHTPSAGELSGIGTCCGCASALFHHVSRRHLKSGRTAVYRYYRCPAKGQGVPCSSPASCRAEEIENFYHGAILEQVGDLPEVVRRQEAGSNHVEKIAELSDRLARLEADYEAGRYDDDTMRESYFRSLRRITSQRRELEAAPVLQARNWFEATGRTVGQAWAAMNTSHRREYLYQVGVRVVVWNTGDDPGRPGIAVRLGEINAMAERLRGLPPAEMPPPPVSLRNVSRAMYLGAVKAGRFDVAPARIRL